MKVLFTNGQVKGRSGIRSARLFGRYYTVNCAYHDLAEQGWPFLIFMVDL